MATVARVSDERASLGRRAEAKVAAHLERSGFRIVERNARIGRLEIDLIARKGSLLVFCEVRARRRDDVMSPVASIDRAKMARVRRAAAQWLRKARQGPVDVRFDAASVVYDVPEGRMAYYEGAF